MKRLNKSTNTTKYSTTCNITTCNITTYYQLNWFKAVKVLMLQKSDPVTDTSVDINAEALMLEQHFEWERSSDG